MIPRIPPALLVMLGSASLYGVKYFLDKTERKALTGSSEQAEQAKRHLRYVRNSGRLAVGSLAVYAGYYAYRSIQERPTPSSVTKEEADFHDNQYSNRDNTYKKNVSSIEEKRRLDEEARLKKLQQEYIK
ncbi:unnamed protein product [Absidia cylindrospora]